MSARCCFADAKALSAVCACLVAVVKPFWMFPALVTVIPNSFKSLVFPL